MADNIKLKEGKAAGAFDGFVETWNYIVDFVHNLKGDGEESSTDNESQNGIRVDRSVPGHPVIRSSATGNGVSTDATSSFTILADIQYNATDHELQKRVCTATVSNGKITSISSPSSWTTITGGAAQPLYAS